jgi:hypothetical protein
MVRQAETKIHKVGSRHTIYLKTDIMNDSNFPFQVGEPLIIRIESDKLIIERKS